MNTPDLKRLFAAGAQLFQQRRFGEAARVFRRATAIAPSAAPAWCNLAAALVELREADEALVAAERAIALAPAFAAAHANRGDALRIGKKDLALACEAYRRAVELQPGSPDFLNKLGTRLQALGQLDAAGEAYARALALAPAYGLARLNYGCLLLLQGRTECAREVAREALALPGLPEGERRDFAAALEIMERNHALAPALHAAVARREPAPFVTLAATPAGAARSFDAVLGTRIAECLKQWPGDGAGHSRAPPDPLGDMLEAHFSAHLGEDAASARGTIDYLREWGERASADLPRPVDDKLLDAHNYHGAIRHYRALGAGAGCDARHVAGWLRYWHALLGSHRLEVGPGELKAFQNSVIINPDIERTEPALVEGTLEHIHATLYATLPPGIARAVVVYWTIIDVHPFADGNGRLGRLLMNRELETAGLSPVVMPLRLKPVFGKALKAMRFRHDLAPFVAWLAECDACTRAIRAELAGY